MRRCPRHCDMGVLPFLGLCGTLRVCQETDTLAACLHAQDDPSKSFGCGQVNTVACRSCERSGVAICPILIHGVSKLGFLLL